MHKNLMLNFVIHLKYHPVSIVLLLLLLLPYAFNMENQKLFTKKSNDFALALYKEIASSTNNNIVISPFSISTCLALVSMGATGKTEEQMLNVLRYGDSKKLGLAANFKEVLKHLNEDKTLNIANKIYLKESFSCHPKFHDLAVNHFFSDTEELDFAQSSSSAKTINDWVANKTNNKIKDLISEETLTELTRVVLINAIHFKGDWEHQFDIDDTHPAPFWVTPDNSIDVPTMSITKHFNYGVLEELDAAVLELRYKDSDISMLIILPNERDGISKLEEKIESLDLEQIKSKLRSKEVELKLPKFKIEYDFDLKTTLIELGMERMFTDAAEFNEMLQNPGPLKVSKVIHKAFIEINEEGAEAAAATVIHMRKKRCASLPVSFNVDHAFLFFVQSNNFSLFYGSMKKIDTINSSQSHDEL